MSNKFRVTWQPDDDYVGGYRPHYFNISDDELEEGADEKELIDLFWGRVRDQFEQRVSAISQDEAEFVEWAKTVLSEREKLEGEQ